MRPNLVRKKPKYLEAQLLSFDAECVGEVLAVDRGDGGCRSSEVAADRCIGVGVVGAK